MKLIEVQHSEVLCDSLHAQATTDTCFPELDHAVPVKDQMTHLRIVSSGDGDQITCVKLKFGLGNSMLQQMQSLGGWDLCLQTKSSGRLYWDNYTLCQAMGATCGVCMDMNMISNSVNLAWR